MSLIVWLKQMTCSHSSRSWITVQATDTLTVTTGGCDRCGKQIPPSCVRCGK